MKRPESKAGVIRTRRAAGVALCLTGYVTTLSFRAALAHSPNRSHLILDKSLDFGLPIWAVAAVNLGFYACIIWGGTILYRSAKGKERILFAGWLVGAILRPLQHLVSISVAANLQYVVALGMLVALLAAVCLLLEGPPESTDQVEFPALNGRGEANVPPNS